MTQTTQVRNGQELTRNHFDKGHSNTVSMYMVQTSNYNSHSFPKTTKVCLIPGESSLFTERGVSEIVEMHLTVKNNGCFCTLNLKFLCCSLSQFLFYCPKWKGITTFNNPCCFLHGLFFSTSDIIDLSHGFHSSSNQLYHIPSGFTSS